MEISKELLSEVLNLNMWETDTLEIKIDENILEYKGLYLGDCGKYTAHEKINIYELAHKCKEWAIGEHGFSLHSFPCPDDTYTCEIYKFHKSTGYVIVNWSNCLSENEAIFESCEWILKETNK